MLYYGGLGTLFGGAAGAALGYMMSEETGSSGKTGSEQPFQVIFAKLKPLMPKGDFTAQKTIESLAHQIGCIIQLAALEAGEPGTAKKRLQLSGTGQALVGQLRLELDRFQLQCTRGMGSAFQEEYRDYEVEFREEVNILAEAMQAVGEEALSNTPS